MSLTPRLLTAADLEDESKYVIARNIPVFAKSKKVKNGKEVNVTTDKLNRALQNAQQNERKHCFPVMTLGHRKPDPNVPETAQPAPVGYVRFHKVGSLGGEPVIYASLHYDRDSAAESMTYPFRSADYYVDTDEITGVALLRRDPELDLGVLTYAREGVVCRYLTDERTMNPDAMPKTNPADPAATPEADAPDEGFLKQFERCMKAKYPHQDKLHASYAASMAPAATPSPAMPSATNSMPAPMPAKKEEPPMPDQHQNPAMALQYTRYEQETKALREEVAAIRYEKELAVCDSLVVGLVAEGKEVGNPVELAKDLAKLDMAGRQARCDYIRQYHKDNFDPARIPHVEVSRQAPGTGPRIDYEACAQYIRQNPGATQKDAEKALAAQKAS